MSCILVFYLLLAGVIGGATAGAPRATLHPHRHDARVGAERLQAAVNGDPDAWYREREDLAKARAAAAIWADRLQKNPREFEPAWKLARARYWLGGRAPEAERKGLLEGGIAAGRAAVAVEPNRPEGHFWIAANMGALAESFGLRQGLKYSGDIKNELLAVLKLDPAFQHGSANRALGRWYFKVPGLFGGSNQKSEEHLRKSLTYNPNSIISHIFPRRSMFRRSKRLS